VVHNLVASQLWPRIAQLKPKRRNRSFTLHCTTAAADAIAIAEADLSPVADATCAVVPWLAEPPQERAELRHRAPE